MGENATQEKSLAKLVPCGLYRTTQPLGTKLQAGVLVYYHNHGNPGPGLYPVDRWENNKAVFSEQGVLVHDYKYPQSLQALPPEGFYRVATAFFCCDKECHNFEPDDLVQLGYDGAGRPILFLPTWSTAGVHLPERGVLVDDDKLELLDPLRIDYKDPPSEDEEDDDLGPPPDPDPVGWDDEGPGPGTPIH